MGNYSLTNIFTKEPVAIASAVRAILFALVLFGLAVDEKQLSGIAIALELVLLLFQRANVTPTNAPSLPEGTPVTSPATGDEPPPDLVVAKVEDVR